MTANVFNYRRLMLTTFIISGCSIIYELLISAVSSYLLGDSILQFSITIGLYMCAMGLGSYLSKFIRSSLFDWFIFVEIGVGIVGGCSALVLFLSNIYLESYQLIMYLEIILIGVMVGLEIPLLTRIIEENTQNLRITLSSIFCFDYIGGLVGSIAFPLLLLPKLGYFSTSFLVGTLNLAVSSFILFSYQPHIKAAMQWKAVIAVSFICMVLGMLFSENLAHSIENGLYRDRVVASYQTPYQKIVVTRHKDDTRLFINGNIQFSSEDEYRYHESLVHVPMAATPSHENILVLGGGDGMAVREILKYPDVSSITLVDLDPDMTRLCRTDENISRINEHSLDNPKLQIINEDAYRFLEESQESSEKSYDVIFVDLPDPNSETLNKLYTNLFYRLCKRSLKRNGILAVQSTSPYYAKEAFWCINKTIESEDLFVYPYHVQVPSFGDWGFQMASLQPLALSSLTLDVPTKYLNQSSLPGLFLFANDETADKEKLSLNTLSHPQLLYYYLEAEKNWN